MKTDDGAWIWFYQGVILVSDSNIIQLIKRAAVEAVEAAKPCDYRIGTVISASPLKIKVSQTMEIEESFLHLSRNVTDFQTEITIDTGTKQTCTVHNALKKGDKVLMLRKAGGQRYAVIDRVVS